MMRTTVFRAIDVPHGGDKPDGKLTEDELFDYLKKNTDNLTDKALSDLVQQAIQQYDTDGDGKLSGKEFSTIPMPPPTP